MGQSKSIPKPINNMPSEITVQWEWQPNPDPLSSEPKQWTPYEPVYNYLLEKAYRDKQKTVDLGDAIVILKGTEIVQQRKSDGSRQKQVRRNEEYESKMNREENNARKKRFFGAETPKIYSRTLGCMEHFLVFFENRGSEIKSFVALFKEIEAIQDMNRLNQEILPLLVDCIKVEAARSKNKQGEKEILDLFHQKIFTNLEQFYGDLLKAYSINGFLYENLNQYLGNEDWTRLDSLLPYAFCLCKGFIWHNTRHNLHNENEENNNVILYRGAQFDEVALRFFDSQAVPTFSWNGVTSTSTERKVAEHVMYNSVDSKKVPVMFIIEIPITHEDLKNSKGINIKPFSVCHNEDEIILGPGNRFNLVHFSRDHRGVEMKLKLVTNVSPLAVQEQIMLGAIQAEMARKKVAKIEGLQKKELEEVMSYLKGNKLFEGLELRKCNFNANTLAKLQATLASLPNLRSLVCVSLTSTENKHINIILQAINKERIFNLEISDEELSGETPDMSLFGQRIKDFTSLSALTLNFSASRRINNESIAAFCSEGLRHLTSLTTLNLNLAGCYMLRDEGLLNLCVQGLRHLTSLKALSLNFAYSYITDKGFESLGSEGLRHLTQLTTLSLDFESAKITFGSLTSIFSEGIRHLPLVTTLTLHIDNCGLTEEELTNFCSEEIKHLNPQTTFTITCYLFFMKNFKFGINNKLVSEAETLGISFVLNSSRPGEPLESDVWNFTRKIKDESIDKTIILTSTDTVSLDSLEELEEFYLKAVEDKQRVTSFTLNCTSFGEHFNDEKLLILCSQGFQHMKSLTTLALNFEKCSKITEKGWAILGYEGIRHLNLLRTLDLDFTFCDWITDESLANFCYDGLKHMNSLTTLALNLAYCSGITDQGLNILGCEGVRHMTSVTSLSLNFKTCFNVTSKGIRDLVLLIRYFGYST